MRVVVLSVQKATYGLDSVLAVEVRVTSGAWWWRRTDRMWLGRIASHSWVNLARGVRVDPALSDATEVALGNYEADAELRARVESIKSAVTAPAWVTGRRDEPKGYR